MGERLCSIYSIIYKYFSSSN